VGLDWPVGENGVDVERRLRALARPWRAVEQVRRASGHVVDLDLSWLVPCDLGVVDALARLQVLVSRCGGLLRLHGVDGGLAELLGFVGLGDVMDLCGCCRGPAQSPPV
jgi:hypothetical protein